MSDWFLRGDMPGFFGFHILFAIGFFLMWLVLVAGAFALLYFVIRLAVTRGILRADALRAAPRHAVPPATSGGPATPPSERRAESAAGTDPSI